MTWRPNPWAFGAIAFCAAFWALAGLASVKLVDAYVDLGARGMRHAIEAQLDRRLPQLIGLMDGQNAGRA